MNEKFSKGIEILNNNNVRNEKLKGRSKKP
jgi:hypothetical protein